MKAGIFVATLVGALTSVAVAQARDGEALCCGRTYLTAGLVDEARSHARRMIAALAPAVARGIAIVGLEPSCLLTLRDETLAMGLGTPAHTVARHALLFEEFLAREARWEFSRLQIRRDQNERIVMRRARRSAGAHISYRSTSGSALTCHIGG